MALNEKIDRRDELAQKLWPTGRAPDQQTLCDNLGLAILDEDFETCMRLL